MLTQSEDIIRDFVNKILEEKTQKFTDQNRQSLDVILNPLKEKIKDFEDKVQKVYDTEAAERNMLKGEIKQLQKATNAQIESLVGSITEDNEQWAKEINTMSNKLKESFSQEIKLAIQNQDKKTQEDGKKYQ